MTTISASASWTPSRAPCWPTSPGEVLRQEGLLPGRAGQRVRPGPDQLLRAEAFDGEVIKDSFPTNTSDFTTYLNKAETEGADVIFCPVSIAYSTQIVKLAASMGLDIPLLGSDTLDSNMVLEAAQGHRRAAVRLHLLSGGRLSRVR